MEIDIKKIKQKDLDFFEVRKVKELQDKNGDFIEVYSEPQIMDITDLEGRKRVLEKMIEEQSSELAEVNNIINKIKLLNKIK
jgi:hypothetical protein